MHYADETVLIGENGIYWSSGLFTEEMIINLIFTGNKTRVSIWMTNIKILLVKK